MDVSVWACAEFLRRVRQVKSNLHNGQVYETYGHP